MEMLRGRRRQTWIEYRHNFRWADSKYALDGYSFPCDAQGALAPDLQEPAREAYEQCLQGAVDGRAIVDLGVCPQEHSRWEPAAGRCSCGAEVELYGFTNTCDVCGADYNSAGQLLAPRCQWGEETGETAADVLAVDAGDSWAD